MVIRTIRRAGIHRSPGDRNKESRRRAEVPDHRKRKPGQPDDISADEALAAALRALDVDRARLDHDQRIAPVVLDERQVLAGCNRHEPALERSWNAAAKEGQPLWGRIAVHQVQDRTWGPN